MSEFNTQNIANPAWAFATLHQHDEKLFAALALEAEVRASEFSAQVTATTAWAFAILVQHDEKLFTALALEAEVRVRTWPTQFGHSRYWVSTMRGCSRSWLWRQRCE